IHYLIFFFSFLSFQRQDTMKTTTIHPPSDKHDRLKILFTFTRVYYNCSRMLFWLFCLVITSNCAIVTVGSYFSEKLKLASIKDVFEEEVQNIQGLLTKAASLGKEDFTVQKEEYIYDFMIFRYISQLFLDT